MSKKNTFLSNSIYFITPQLSGKFIGVITLPILLAILDKSTYGKIAFLLGIQQIIFTITSNGARQSVLKFFYNCDNDSRKKIISYSLVQTISRSLVAYLIILGFNSFFNLGYGMLLINIFFLGVLLMSLETLFDSIMISVNMVKQNSVSNIIKSISSPILIILMTYFNPQVEIYFLAISIVFGLKLAYSILISDFSLEVGSSTLKLKDFTKYSTNMMTLNFNQKISKWSDRILLGILISQESLAEYHAVLQLVLVLEFITNGFVTSFKAQVFNSKKYLKEENIELYEKLILIIFLIAIAGSSLRFNLGTAILEKEYWSILELIPFLALAIFLNSIFKITTVIADKESNLINYKKISFSTTIFNIFISGLGLYYFEITGLITAVVATYIFKNFLLYLDKNFQGFPKVNYLNFLGWITAYIAIELLCFYLSNAGQVTIRWLFSLVLLFFIADNYFNLKKFVTK